MIELSIIVPAWNEEACLPKTLARMRSAAESSGATFELIVVDDESSDQTAAVSRAAGARVVSVKRRQIAAVRNDGARESTGKYLLFVDADTLVTPEVVAAALVALRGGAAGGGALVQMEGPLSWHVRAFLGVFMPLWRLTGWAAGCFIFANRTDFETVGGFDEDYFASEEVWLSKALKARGRFVIVKHPVLSSGRKGRMQSPLIALTTMFWLGLRGPSSCKTRKGLGIWYDGFREPTPPKG